MCNFVMFSNKISVFKSFLVLRYHIDQTAALLFADFQFAKDHATVCGTLTPRLVEKERF